MAAFTWKNTPNETTPVSAENLNKLLQIVAGGARQMVSGYVTSAGGIESGEGFTVKKEATGRYKVTFSSEMSILPAITATPVTSAFVPFWALRNVTKSSFEIAFWKTTSGTAEDVPFSFHAVG